MNAVSNEKRPTSMAFYIRPTGCRPVHKFPLVSRCTTWSRASPKFKLFSLGRHWVLFALGRHWVLTNGTWHVLLQSGNVFELGGITSRIVIGNNELRTKKISRTKETIKTRKTTCQWAAKSVESKGKTKRKQWEGPNEYQGQRELLK